jgi:hypothetical protein
MNGGSNGRARQRYVDFRRRGFERLVHRRNRGWIVVMDSRLIRPARRRRRRRIFRPGCGLVAYRIFFRDVVIPGIEGDRISGDHAVDIPQNNGVCTP